MTVAQRIAAFQQSADVTMRAAEFVRIAQALLAAPNAREAREFLKRVPVGDRVLEMFERAAVPSAAGSF